MFSSTTKASPDAITTILGEGTEVNGDLSFKDTLRIDGQFDGNLTGDHLIISASGRILGDVCAISCVCYGQIRGNLTLDALQVKKGGRIDGTISADDLEVESGAVLIGEIGVKKKELRLVDDATGVNGEATAKNAAKCK